MTVRGIRKTIPGGTLLGNMGSADGAAQAIPFRTLAKAIAANSGSLTAQIDGAFGSAQGSILYRDSVMWKALGPGTSGWFLKTAGAGANPAWAAGNAGDVVGPAGATSGSVALFDGTTGKLIKDGGTAYLTGADPTGATDSTTALNNVISALGSGGGKVFLPRGKYAVNVTLPSGVTLVGQGSASDSPGTAVSLVPWATANPVVTIGADAATVRDAGLQDITLYAAGPNGTGTAGLLLGGGALACNFSRIAAINFTTYCVKIKAGATYPVVFCIFDGLKLQATDGASLVGVFVNDGSGAAGAAANYISHMTMEGPVNNGYGLVNDTATLFIAESWMQLSTNHGVHELNSAKIVGDGLTVDSNATTDILMQVDISTDAAKILSTWIEGEVNFDGSYKLADGTVITRADGTFNAVFPTFFKPIIYGDMVFGDPSDHHGYNANFPHIYGTSGGTAAHLVLMGGTTGHTYLETGDGTVVGDVEPNGNFVIGAAGAIATNATDGFLYLTAGAGAPTGVPRAITGKLPVYIDSTNNKLYFYSGSWRLVTST